VEEELLDHGVAEEVEEKFYAFVEVERCLMQHMQEEQAPAK
jgi:hypothetical protein